MIAIAFLMYCAKTEHIVIDFFNNDEKRVTMRKNKKILLIVLLAVGILLGGCVWYIGNYYHVTDLENALAETNLVKITKIDTGYWYDGPGKEDALIFYPGAKVEDIAYAPLLKMLAEQGVDCFLVHMPCNLAFFGINKAEKIMDAYEYEQWFLAGHSLGGAMAAEYADKNSDRLDGLIFLAAYSTKDLAKTGLNILSIYGSEDKVLNMEKMQHSRLLMPDSYQEYCIVGGNHAGYGDYGAQKGDGTASITAQIQRQITVEKILKMIKRNVTVNLDCER